MNQETFMNEQNLNDITAEPQDNESREPQESKKKATFLSEFFDYFELFIISACAVLMLFSIATRLCRVDGPSMLNTLHDGEMLIVSDLFYTPKRGDIIVFHQTGDNPGDLNEPIVKRVIATEGEWISIEKNSSGTLTVCVYESEDAPVVITETYANYENGVGYYNYDGKPVQVPENCLFVMGDNRGNSQDSRAESIGFVDCRRVLGKVICRLTPLDKFGFVN